MSLCYLPRLFSSRMVKFYSQFQLLVYIVYKKVHFLALEPVCKSVCLHVCLSAYLSVCMSVCLHACLSASLFVCKSFCLHVCLSGCLDVSMSRCLDVSMSACLSEAVRLKFGTDPKLRTLENSIWERSR